MAASCATSTTAGMSKSGKLLRRGGRDSGETTEIESRWLLVEPGLNEVSDVVETWNDLRTPGGTGTITGIVEQVESGAPLMDVNVSVGGIHTASDYDGRFKISGIAAGTQRITVFRNLGDYKPASATVEVPQGGTADVTIAMEAAQPVQVTFDVALPDDTPGDAGIWLAGSVFQAGARPGTSANMPVMGGDLQLPALERTVANRADTTLLLHEGTYVQYFYSIGSSSRGREYDYQGRYAYRSFVVDASSPVRQDRVESWRPSEHSVLVTLRVEVPLNTTPGVKPVFTAGPSHWMTQTGPYEWTMFLYGNPGQLDQYRYVLGDVSAGTDGTDGIGQDGLRTLVFPDTDTVVRERVERWTWSPEVSIAPQGQPTEMTFRVTVPPSTSGEAIVRLVGEDPVLEQGIDMVQRPGNPWLYEAVVPLNGGESYRYWFERGSPGTRSRRIHEVVVRHTNQEVSDWVVGWSDTPTESLGKNPEFIAGIYTPDFWSSGFMDLSSAAFERIKGINGGWVVVSSVWSYGQFDPPTVEPRRVQAPSALTPREDIVAQSGIAHEKGLSVILGAQFNMEMIQGGTNVVCRSHPQEWLDAWLGEAERLWMWMWNATVAAEADAEALVLPATGFTCSARWTTPRSTRRSSTERWLLLWRR